MAAIATGVIGIFQWRESYPRCTYVCESLRSEKAKFLTRSSENYAPNLTDQQALNNFVMRVEALVINEITDWRAQTESQTEKASESKDLTRAENAS